MENNPIKRILRRFVGAPECDCGATGTDVRVAAVKDVPADKPLCVTVGGKEMAVCRLGDKFYALDNFCAHMGGPLCQGRVDDGVVTCPWHGAKYRVENGEVVSGPAKKGVGSQELEVRGEDLFLKAAQTVAAKKGASPVPADLAFGQTLDKERPFDHEPFLREVEAALKFPFKLYGVLPLVLIYQAPDEIDFHLGPIHATEKDLRHLSALLDGLNAKWGTAVTYCLYHSDQFPGDMLLNLRGPKAPPNLDQSIRFKQG